MGVGISRHFYDFKVNDGEEHDALPVRPPPHHYAELAKVGPRTALPSPSMVARGENRKGSLDFGDATSVHGGGSPSMVRPRKTMGHCILALRGHNATAPTQVWHADWASEALDSDIDVDIKNITRSHHTFKFQVGLVIVIVNLLFVNLVISGCAPHTSRIALYIIFIGAWLSLSLSPTAFTSEMTTVV